MERLVYLGENKQLYVYTPESGQNSQLTYSFNVGESAPAIWPVWSPDGRWIAYFQPPGNNNNARICISEVDGIEVRVLAELSDRSPIYIKWSPTSTHLAIIEQVTQLQMVVYSINGDKSILLDEGSPIFFDWLPDGSGIVAHLINPVDRKSSVQYYSIEDSELDYIISNKSGGFCSPVFIQDQLIYADQNGDSTHIVLHNLSSNEATTLCAFNGVVAIQPRPNRTEFAVAVTSRGDGSPYTGIQLFDLESGELSCLYEGIAQSLFWNSTGERLLLSYLDNVNRCMQWKFWDEKEDSIKTIGKFWPTREQLFFLHFFEQFSLSHNTLSADGEHFYFSAYEPPTERTSTPPKPFVYKGTFKENASFDPLLVGLFPALNSWEKC